MPQADRNSRREKRVKFTTHAALATAPGSGNLIEDASTIDLSESGVRVRLSGQIEPGQVVDLYLGKRPEQCRVVWTSPDGPRKGFIAGLQFLYPLPDPRRRETPSSSEFEPAN